MISTKRVEHLGLVAGTCEFLEIAKFIDERIPKLSNNSKLTHGEIFVCLLINALSFVARPMYLSSRFFAHMDMQTLLGKNIDPKWLNDDAIGRTLDALFEYGVSDLYLELAANSFNKVEIPYKIAHLDSTSFHVHGNGYEQEAYITIDGSSTKQPIEVVMGYSRDNHPELKQVILSMISDTIMGCPLFMNPEEGNKNDNKSFNYALNLIASMKNASIDYLVADSALYTEANLQDAKKLNQKIITHAPTKLKEVKDAIRLAQAQGFTLIRDQYSGFLTSSNYGGIDQTWLVVHSIEAAKRCEKTVENKASKELEKVRKELKKLTTREFNCEPDAVAELSKYRKKLHLVNLVNEKITEVKKRVKKGRPAKNEQVGEHEISIYFINSDCELNQQAIAEEKEIASCFVIATNDTSRTWRMQELLDTYKSQQKVERGFRFLKDPKFFTDSLFIKTPSRIESLLMIMVSSLMVYSINEYITRQKLKNQRRTIKSQVNKATDTPTMRWIYDVFSNIDVIYKENKPILYGSLDTDQRTIVETLEVPWIDIYKNHLLSI
ncbi:MAG: IS1634 family transposase [Methanobrevibacter sp.]|uniref:IS1634 family transposase n=1 Tax=Methanobrevibacter sp. TaxID=66852 RepID=UPI003F0D04DC